MIRNVDERITRIKNEHEELMRNVRTCILEHGEQFLADVDSFAEVLKKDNEAIKKYNALINAQNMIKTFIQDILNAKTIEEITSIRSKLNYYINKIKAEMVRRNIDESTLNAFSEKARLFRSDIARKIRFLKRNEKISTIDNMYSRIKSLSEEEKSLLNKLIKTESRYNSANCKKNNITPSNTVKKGEESSNLSGTTCEKSSFEPKKTASAHAPKYTGLLAGINKFNSQPYIDFLQDQAEHYESEYGICATYDYVPGRNIKNFVSFLKNIPIMRRNKKQIKKMEPNINNAAIESYYIYLMTRNSLRNSLACLRDPYYFSYECNRLLSDHEMCASWMLNYCREKSLLGSLPINENGVSSNNLQYGKSFT